MDSTRFSVNEKQLGATPATLLACLSPPFSDKQAQPQLVPGRRIIHLLGLKSRKITCPFIGLRSGVIGMLMLAGTPFRILYVTQGLVGVHGFACSALHCALAGG